MTFQSKNLGERGEDLAVGFLEGNDYKILERNWKCPIGEIDVVAKKDNILVFIEVKTKASLDFGLPEEMVTKRKQEKLIKLAEYYLKEKNLQDVDYRFDLVAIILEDDKESLRLIENIISK